VERQLERDEERELQAALGTGELPADFTVEINSAARSDLMRLPGVGETLTDRIIEKRPYTRLTDLLEVDGIGPARLEKLRPLVRI
jgi:competence protein ComEA